MNKNSWNSCPRGRTCQTFLHHRCIKFHFKNWHFKLFFRKVGQAKTYNQLHRALEIIYHVNVVDTLNFVVKTFNYVNVADVVKTLNYVAVVAAVVIVVKTLNYVVLLMLLLMLLLLKHLTMLLLLLLLLWRLIHTSCIWHTQLQHLVSFLQRQEFF